MYRKLNICNCLVTFLLFFCSTYADQSKNNYRDNNSSINKTSGLNTSKFKAISENKILKKVVSIVRSGSLDVKNWPIKFSQWLKTSPFFLFVLVSHIFIFIFLFFARRKRKENRFMTTTKLSIMNGMVQQACRYIEKNYHKSDLTAEKMCSDLITGRAYLEALFLKELGMKIEEFIDHSRITRVKAMLHNNPHTSMVDITNAVGFTDESKCVSKFKKICGVDIQTYRDNLISNREMSK